MPRSFLDAVYPKWIGDRLVDAPKMVAIASCGTAFLDVEDFRDGTRNHADCRLGFLSSRCASILLHGATAMMAHAAMMMHWFPAKSQW